MANDSYVGPINYVVFSLPPAVSPGAGLMTIMEKVASGSIEILDIEWISISDGQVPTAGPLTAFEAEDEFDPSVFEGAITYLLDADDLSQIAEELEPGWSAIAIVYEDRSLASAAHAFANVGGIEMLAGGIDVSALDRIINREG